MLGQRLIAAAIIVPTMLVLVWLDFQLGSSAYLGRPGLVISVFAVVIAALASAELMDMWSPHRASADVRHSAPPSATPS